MSDVKVCCQDFEKCRELCVPRADYWQGQASQLRAGAAAERAKSEERSSGSSAAGLILPSMRDQNLQQPTPTDGASYQHGYSWGWNDCIRCIKTTPTAPIAGTEDSAERHVDASDRFKVEHGAYWWTVRIGDGQQTVGKFHTEKAAQELAFQLLRAFRDGHFAATHPNPPKPDTAAREGVPSGALPPLTDAMYHAVRGLEFATTDSQGYEGVPFCLCDDDTDCIWDAINTALRIQRAAPEVEPEPVAWCDDRVLAGGIGNCASKAAKEYWAASYWVDRERAERLKHPLYAVPPEQSGEPVAWLHIVKQNEGDEEDQALSFAPDNFPLMGEAPGLFQSLRCVPLFTSPPPEGPAVAALRRLVALQDAPPIAQDGEYGMAWMARTDEYETRFQVAWEAARKALSNPLSNPAGAQGVAPEAADGGSCFDNGCNGCEQCTDYEADDRE